VQVVIIGEVSSGKRQMKEKVYEIRVFQMNTVVTYTSSIPLRIIGFLK
jgi:hypothetical protein